MTLVKMWDDVRKDMNISDSEFGKFVLFSMKEKNFYLNKTIPRAKEDKIREYLYLITVQMKNADWNSISL